MLCTSIKRHSVVFLLPLLLFLCILTEGQNSVEAQTGPVPSLRFYNGTHFLNQGDLHAAQSWYQEELRNSTKIGSGRWIDAICYYAMLGETCYIAGDYTKALEHFDSAVSLYVEYSNWLTRVTYVFGIQTSPPASVAWGPGMRHSPIGQFPGDANILLGDQMTEERIKQGGAISQQRQIRINPIAILESMALAVRRRIDILGPLVKYDPASQVILSTFSTRTVPPSHWSIPWLDVLFGLALEGVGKTADATNILKESLLVGGQCDHSLTSTALLTLGKLYLQADKPQEAAVCFHEASISAARFGNYLVVEESLRYYSNAQKTFSRDTQDPVLTNAHQWSSEQSNLRLLQISLSEELAESLIIAKNFKQAASGLQLIDRMMDNRGLRASRYSDHWNYLSAIVAYSAGRTDEGDRQLTQAIEGMKSRSPWFFQISALDRLASVNGFTSVGSVNLRGASELYEYLFREPTPNDWASQPMDSFVVQNSIPLEAFERWFFVLRERDQREESFLLAERIRRQRFYSQLPMGGRLFSLRYLLNANPELLDDSFRVKRQDILQEFPEYGQISKQVGEYYRQLHSLPVVPVGEEEQKKQKMLLAKVAELSAVQESLLRYIAAGRLAIPIVFPPIRSVADMQLALPKETSLLTFFNADGMMFGFMLTRDMIDFWQVGATPLIAESIAIYLKMLGNSDANRSLEISDLEETKWKTEGKKLLEKLLGDRRSEGKRFSVVFKHLVVVPDHVLWYLPFETLSVPSSNGEIPLLEVPDLTVRYAATAGLALPEKLGRDALPGTVVVPGTLYPRSPEKIQKDAILRLSQSLRKMEVFSPESLNVSSGVLAPRLKRLVVFNEILADRTGDFSWTPFIAGRAGNNDILQWGYLPWGAPRVIVLPGFRSVAENSLKKTGGNGNEFFFPLMTMQANGANTILISRWRTGGRSAYDLTQFFLQNLTEMVAPLAWKNAVQQESQNTFVPDEEPALRKPGQSVIIPAVTHPLFWGGYMLVDRGEIDETPLLESPKPDEEGPPASSAGMEVKESSPATMETKEGETPPKNSADTLESPSEKISPPEKTLPLKKPKGPVTTKELEEADKEADDFYGTGK